MLRAIAAVSEVKAKGDEKIGVQIICKALESPIRQIVANCGLDGSVVADEVRNMPTNTGYDANAGKYVDMYKAGIIDPAKVVKRLGDVDGIIVPGGFGVRGTEGKIECIRGKQCSRMQGS